MKGAVALVHERFWTPAGSARKRPTRRRVAGVRFVIRWFHRCRLIDENGIKKKAWEIARGKRSWEQRTIWDTRRYCHRNGERSRCVQAPLYGFRFALAFFWSRRSLEKMRDGPYFALNAPDRAAFRPHHTRIIPHTGPSPQSYRTGAALPHSGTVHPGYQ